VEERKTERDRKREREREREREKMRGREVSPKWVTLPWVTIRRECPTGYPGISMLRGGAPQRV
jgi:hypothetical protein